MQGNSWFKKNLGFDCLSHKICNCKIMTKNTDTTTRVSEHGNKQRNNTRMVVKKNTKSVSTTQKKYTDIENETTHPEATEYFEGGATVLVSRHGSGRRTGEGDVAAGGGGGEGAGRPQAPTGTRPTGDFIPLTLFNAAGLLVRCCAPCTQVISGDPPPPRGGPLCGCFF